MSFYSKLALPPKPAGGVLITPSAAGRGGAPSAGTGGIAQAEEQSASFASAADAIVEQALASVAQVVGRRAGVEDIIAAADALLTKASKIGTGSKVAYSSVKAEAEKAAQVGTSVHAHIVGALRDVKVSAETKLDGIDEEAIAALKRFDAVSRS